MENLAEKRALVIGASGGIGSALVRDLSARGFDVTGMSRSVDGLEVTEQASVEAHLGALDGPFEVIFVATGALQISGPPEKSLRALSAAGLAEQFAVNAIGPALVLRHAPRLLPRDRPAVFATLSARVGSIGDNRLGGWYSYRAAKAALNQLVHGAAIEIGRSHKQARILALHPGTVATPFTATFVAPEKATPPADAAARLVDVALGGAETGGFYDYAGHEIPW
jgi:NAD(P)-dependent dehydrogenase (short-subunit alcohol dehydrogenase family)